MVCEGGTGILCEGEADTQTCLAWVRGGKPHSASADLPWMTAREDAQPSPPHLGRLLGTMPSPVKRHYSPAGRQCRRETPVSGDSVDGGAWGGPCMYGVGPVPVRYTAYAETGLLSARGPCCQPLHTELRLAVTGRMGELQQQAPGAHVCIHACMHAPWGVPAGLSHPPCRGSEDACMRLPSTMQPCRGCPLTLFLACAALACATTKLLTIFLLPSFESTLNILTSWACSSSSSSCSRFWKEKAM